MQELGALSEFSSFVLLDSGLRLLEKLQNGYQMGALWVKIQGNLIIAQNGFKTLFDGCTLGEDPRESHSGICNYVLWCL